jgi:hypothetical protein
MIQFAEVLELVPTLTAEQRGELRIALDQPSVPAAPQNDPTRPKCSVVGFLADEPELADELLRVIAENRARPFRVIDPAL